MKKYSSGSFIDAALRVYGSEADTISSFPATIYADGESASAIVYGNMQQTGTPTPTTPITPSECGDLETTGEHSGQYKIPIESANTSTTVYLNQVQTTRKIKKLVFDGTETWYRTSGGIFNYYLTPDTPLLLVECICTHYIGTAVRSFVALEDGQCTTSIVSSDIPRFALSDNDYADITTFKAYLAEQFANGTPVTVWYVLDESTTGILNEPIRKISTYSDTVSATIPTVAAADNINVTTTLKPSAVQLTYTGWHDHSDKKRSGGAWT